MLCENCHKTEATCHICQIVDGISQSRDLCHECYKAGSPEVDDFETAQREARCQYCGGPPAVGGTDTFALTMGIQKFKFTCLPCSMEHNRYIQQTFQQTASRLPQPEQMALIQKINEEADRHMKQWVLEQGL